MQDMVVQICFPLFLFQETAILLFFRKKYEDKFDPDPPRALFKGNYGAYREEGAALDQKFAYHDEGLAHDPWEQMGLE